ncbi:MAG: hypothetical protein ACOCUJ_02565 [Thiohalospira sp.]|uniref:hypothetical protein n=1 Tax=Thiohalospira sp. TaxID=3080549 RepID=UPI0039809305
MKKMAKGLMGRMGWGATAAAATLAAVAVWTVLAVEALEYDPQAKSYHGWGDEALARVHEGLADTAPIELANACGMGTSSCFKCHNGERADEPAEKDWHKQHSEVNDSCVGCHQGNDRLMAENMAHKELLADPRKHGDKACASCHDDGEDIDSLLDAYAD